MTDSLVKEQSEYQKAVLAYFGRNCIFLFLLTMLIMVGYPLGVYHLNVLRLTSLSIYFLFPAWLVLGSLLSVLHFSSYMKGYRGGKLAALRSFDTKQWWITCVAVSVTTGAVSVLPIYVIISISVGYSSTIPFQTDVLVERIHIIPARKAMSFCEERVDFRTLTGVSETICTQSQRWFGRSGRIATGTLHVGDKCLLRGRVGALGAIVDEVWC